MHEIYYCGAKVQKIFEICKFGRMKIEEKCKKSRETEERVSREVL